MSTTETPTAGPLVGTHCATCDRGFYPARRLCPTCWAEDLPENRLPATGVLATWTVVRMGKRFETPYALCYADFEGDIRVLGRVVNWVEGKPLAAGMTVRTHPVDATDGDGRTATIEHVVTVDYDAQEN